MSYSNVDDKPVDSFVLRAEILQCCAALGRAELALSRGADIDDKCCGSRFDILKALFDDLLGLEGDARALRRAIAEREPRLRLRE